MQIKINRDLILNMLLHIFLVYDTIFIKKIVLKRSGMIDMEKVKVDRINELARLAKERELTDEEKKEQKTLREEYMAEFRRTIRGKE